MVIKEKVLKELHEQIEPILQIKFKKSFDTGQTPMDWKHASIATVFKRGDTHYAVNYGSTS